MIRELNISKTSFELFSLKIWVILVFPFANIKQVHSIELYRLVLNVSSERLLKTKNIGLKQHQQQP